MNADQVKQMIDRVGPHIDARYDYTYGPHFPEGRSDVCVVKRLAEDGSSYGYDTLYLVWEAEGKLRHQVIDDTQSNKDYLYIDSLQEEGDDIVVGYRNGGSFSGKPSSMMRRFKKKSLGLV